MALKFKSPNTRLKKVLIYGKDGTGKSTFAAQYCKDNNFKPVVIDVEDTNFTGLPIVDMEFSNDRKIYQDLINIIDEIKDSEFDTIILDGVSSLLELLVSKAKGLKKYSDRAERFQDVLTHLTKSKKNIIFIGQIDMEVIYGEEYQSSKQVIKTNSLVNEKYICYKKKNGFSVKQVKNRDVSNISETISSEFTTADNIEKIDSDPVAENLAKSLCIFAKKQGKPCRKGVLIACAKQCDKLSQEEKERVIKFLRDLPNGEIKLDD